MNGTIENCINEGNISGNNYQIGGITGFAGWYNTSSKTYRKEIITNCKNKGVVSSTSSVVGGIVGTVHYGTNVLNCINYGNVSSTGKDGNSRSLCGGIVGQAQYTGENTIKGCKNYGGASSQYYMCGGIVAWLQKGTISNCENQGNVTNGRRNTGGIVGNLGRNDDTAKTKGMVENCVNTGNIEQTLNEANCHNTGGIAGSMTNGSSIIKCANMGNVTTHGYFKVDSVPTNKSSCLGGICGNLSTVGANSISYCYNTGNIKGEYRIIGGIVGFMHIANQKVEYCYSTGNVVGPTGVLNIGGIVGYRSAGEVIGGYYLENTVIDINGNEQAKRTAIGDLKNGAGIKSITELNIWKDHFKMDKTPNINKGFPILSWQ